MLPLHHARLTQSSNPPPKTPRPLGMALRLPDAYNAAMDARPLAFARTPAACTLLAAALAGACALPAAGQSAPASQAVARTLPEGGRSYHVLAPAGRMLRGAPLVVYLHPSRADMFAAFERDYWPMLARRRCVVVMPRSKGGRMWLAGEEKYVADCIDDAEKRCATDPKRVLLLGISGGGQAALFLADRIPQRFRAVIVVSTAPQVIRGRSAVWFYPNRDVLKTCPYFVVNHLSEGESLMFWRQVRHKLRPAGASITILPVLGEAGHYRPPPPELGAWLDEVLAGKCPVPPPDPQAAAVAKMFRKAADALPNLIAAAKPDAASDRLNKAGRHFRLSVPMPKDFGRSAGEDSANSTGEPLTQIRIEHKTWPIYVRCEACRTAKPMAEVLAAEDAETAARGMCYQVYHEGTADVGARKWQVKIGSITFPHAKRGWVSTLFVRAVSAAPPDPRGWACVLILDETQQPDAAELARLLKTLLAGMRAAPAAPAPPRK